MIRPDRIGTTVPSWNAGPKLIHFDPTAAGTKRIESNEEADDARYGGLNVLHDDIGMGRYAALVGVLRPSVAAFLIGLSFKLLDRQRFDSGIFKQRFVIDFEFFETPGSSGRISPVPS